ncbi:hypothetical protein AcW2_004849 [Taiwanofungus camphoratus]|nr:hypothetical protein AcW2_004849 [Antrodia cinnamomea]
MNASCSICFEDLNNDLSPITTTCGHLYCLDCATYNFANPGATCAICRRPHSMDSLIRLYPTDMNDKKSGASSSKRPCADEGHRILDSCYNVLEDVDFTAVEPILKRTEDFIDGLSDNKERPDVSDLLGPMLTVLTEIRSKLRDATHIQELEDERDKLKHAVRKLRDRVKNSDKVHKAEQMDAEIKFLQGTIEWAERTSEVQRSLEEVQQKLSVERAKVQSSNMTIEKLEAEMKQWRASCNRYKKKVSDCALHLMRSY